MTDQSRDKKKLSAQSIVLLWLFFIAFLLRMIWIIQYQASPFFDNPSLDFTFFDQRAKEILNGQWFSSDYLFNPLYPYFLAIMYAIFGMDLFFPRLIQALFGALLVFPVYHIANYAFNRRSALIAAGLCALYMPLIYYDGILMATTLQVLFLTVSVALVAGKLTRMRLLISGLLMGLVLLAAPNYLIVSFAVAGWIAFFQHKCPGLKTVSAAILYLAGVIIVVSPITVYHAVRNNEFVFVAPHGGINFYIGNHEQATGSYMMVTGISNSPGQQTRDSKKIVSEKLGRPATNREVSAFWVGKSLEFMKNNPVAFAKLQIRKLALFWNAYEIPSEYGLDFDSRFHSILRLPLFRFGWIAPFALTGLLMIPAKKQLDKRKALLPVCLLVSVMIAVIIFFVHARYRMPATPWLLMFAGFCVSSSVSHIKQNHWKTMILIAVCLAAGFSLTWLDLTEQTDLPGWFNRALAHIALGQMDEAEECLQEILRQDSSPKAWFYLGTLQMMDDRLEDAEFSFQNVLVQDTDNFEALMNLSQVYIRKEQYEAARRLLERTVRVHSDTADAPILLAELYIRMDMMDNALSALENLDGHTMTTAQRYRVDVLERQIKATLDTLNENAQKQEDLL